MAKTRLCWKDIEVSSNDKGKFDMLDRDHSTYWETSEGGNHWIKLHMIESFVIK